MKVAVLGASGATGRWVVKQLLEQKVHAKVIVRGSAVLERELMDDENLEIIRGEINALTVQELRELLKDCDSVVCCLGHRINLKGIFGKPRKLVWNAVRKVTEALASFPIPKKFVLMSTTAYTNFEQDERESIGEKVIFSLLKILLPPHKDNVLSVDYLIYTIQKSDKVEWVAVRPDSLIDDSIVSAYRVSSSRLRSPIFDSGRTSRINVAHFILELLRNDSSWQKWKYKTPVIYNREQAV